MPGKKKDFTKSDGAVDKLFTVGLDGKNAKESKHTHDKQHTQHTYDTLHTQHTYETQHTHVSKRVESGGKRNERFGLLLDGRLKSDLILLSKAKGSKSVNDLIVTVLAEYVQQKENALKLEQYKKLLEE